MVGSGLANCTKQTAIQVCLMFGFFVSLRQISKQQIIMKAKNLILMAVTLLFAVGCTGPSNKKNHFVAVTLVSSRETIKVPKSEFVGNDTVYRNREGVYKNDTGKDLVKYSVKYTKDGSDTNKPIGLLIKPNEYFYWNDNENSFMFRLPPNSTSVTYRSSYGKSHKLDFTYLEFLDYADRVANDVNIVGYSKN